jgi:predicted membrane chloride channel (bestrophin family)
MDEAQWSLVGVFLGWFLTSLNSGFDHRRKNKQLIGNLLVKLLRVYRQVDTLIHASENVKDLADDWVGYEALRKRMVDRHFLEPDTVRDDLRAAINEVAPIHPFLGTKLYLHLPVTGKHI